MACCKTDKTVQPQASLFSQIVSVELDMGRAWMSISEGLKVAIVLQEQKKKKETK